MKPVHFTCMICVDWDLDILPHWIRHYAQYDIATRHVFLHSPSESDENIDKAMEMLIDAGFSVERVSGDFKCGSMRQRYFQEFQESLPANEYLMAVDSDEFCEMKSTDLAGALGAGYDTVRGRLVDRFDTYLHDALSFGNLGVQYPFVGEIDKIIEWQHPELMGIAYANRQKIIVSRCGHTVNHVGSHAFLNTDHKWNAAPNTYAINHYSWRESAFLRMIAKHYHQAPFMWHVGKMFKLTDEFLHEVLADSIVKYEEMCASKGWS